ncbi:zinc finger BED domain-containing protein RICESLEEPER 3-like [Juglans microcarpa x Juglans regia]|uniref:zinc finger BED domain-containing protein RICESLEEPER 3-like n=1 Tax=Juglans microcarpa x Juglans regia TaxID=2249226 RepID=UPI001B7DE065|nr:zinc finger BED domain-containing protein RICESLEEPER 3-like [Juglans microcarpa x Juglans regia]
MQVLGFKKIQDHKDSSIGKELDDCMTDWGITKFLTITVDNTTTNDGAIDWFKRNCIVKEDTILDNVFIHVRCYAHIINLIVNEGLKEVGESIIKVRKIVKYVMGLDKFKSIVEQLKIPHSSMLILDVPTRWNSTYTMLEVAQKYLRSFERMEVEDGALKYALLEDTMGRRGLGPPDTVDWENLEELLGLYDHLRESCESSVGLLNDMAIRMKFKYDKYWGDGEKINKLLLVVAILDSQYKLVIVEFCIRDVLGNDKAEQFIGVLEYDIDALYNHYNNNGGQS